MNYIKYEFPPAIWAELQKEIQQTTTFNEQTLTSWKDCAVVEIGFICLEKGEVDGKQTCIKESDKWAVDILFYAAIPASFEPYSVYPQPKSEVHSFWGDEDLYLKTFCGKYPTSEYCKIPEIAPIG